MAVVELISTVPVSVSLTDHKKHVSSAPPDVMDLPPILRHKQTDVRVAFDPPIDNNAEWTPGTLYVTDSHLAFVQNGGDKGFRLAYPSIVLHAVSRSDSGQPAVICQLEDNSLEQRESDKEELECPQNVRELEIRPNDVPALSNIFEALSFCISLRDPQPVFLEGDFDDSPDTGRFETFCGTQDEELRQVGKAALDYLESITDLDPSKTR